MAVASAINAAAVAEAAAATAERAAAERLGSSRKESDLIGPTVAKPRSVAKAATTSPEEARSTTASSRATGAKSLDRSVDPQNRGTATEQDRGAAQTKLAVAKPARWIPDKTVQAKAAALGLAPDRRYEFKDAKGRSSWIVVGKDDAQFVDSTGKKFLTLGFETMYEVLETTGHALPEAGLMAESAMKYHEALVEEYYAYFRHNDGNSGAKSRMGSGKFRYKLAKQHLADSVANELTHVFWKFGQRQLEEMMSKLADAKPGMECYGTTMLNVLKARGLVPPSMGRAEFESRYADVLAALPKGQRHHVLIGGGGGAQETKEILETLNSRLSKLDWARFTGMADKKATVKILSKENQIGTEVEQGYSVFVQVPGHFKSAIGGDAGDLEYDDPLGTVGHILYSGKPAVYGVVIE